MAERTAQAKNNARHAVSLNASILVLQYALKPCGQKSGIGGGRDEPETDLHKRTA